MLSTIIREDDIGDISEHFSLREFFCPDCDRATISRELLNALELLRAQGPEPIIVLSGYRCPQHNSGIGGAGKSQHVTGKAADIRIEGLTLLDMYDRALKVPAFFEGGIGLYEENFIHVDVRIHGKGRWARVSGQYVPISRLIEVA